MHASSPSPDSCHAGRHDLLLRRRRIAVTERKCRAWILSSRRKHASISWVTSAASAFIGAEQLVIFRRQQFNVEDSTRWRLGLFQYVLTSAGGMRLAYRPIESGDCVKAHERRILFCAEK